MQGPPHGTGHQPRAVWRGSLSEAVLRARNKSRAKSWTFRSVADAKQSETRNSPVESCYEQPPAWLITVCIWYRCGTPSSEIGRDLAEVDILFHGFLGPVSRAHSCKPKRKPKGNTRDGSQRRERGRPMGSARSVSPVGCGSVEQAYIASWQPENSLGVEGHVAVGRGRGDADVTGHPVDSTRRQVPRS